MRNNKSYTITEDNLKLLMSFIIKDLKCDCGCKYHESFNEPCSCGWTHVVEWFEDYDIKPEIDLYLIKKFYLDEYGYVDKGN